VVRRAYEAFNQADGAVLQRLSDDCVQHMSGDHRFAGTQKGRDAILAMYGQMGVLAEGTLQARPERVFVNQDLVAVVHRETARRSGRTLDAYNCLVFRLAEGRIVELTELAEDGADEGEFWS
jgi:uncharacterized protein